MRLARYSVVFGTLACLGFPFNPMYRGCLGNPLFLLFAGFAGLGLLCGTLGLIGTRRGLALAGMGLSIASPFGTLLATPPYHGSNEPATIGDIRTVIVAQAAYQAANAGYYGTPECLAHPSACLAGYPVSGPTFLDSMIASGLPKSGYSRRFVAGPPPPNGQPRSMTSWAYVAVPVTPGRTGIRGFCGDSTGEICMTTQGQEPPVADGLCLIYEMDNTSPCVLLR
jgi:hypothetical protein